MTKISDLTAMTGSSVDAANDLVTMLDMSLSGVSRNKKMTFAELLVGVAAIPSAYLDTDGTLAANSDTKVASQKAVKTYVGTAVTGLLELKGGQDCSANPNYPAASKGDAYVVTVAGKIGGASGTSVSVGDVYFASADNAGGTQASVGSSWDVIIHSASLTGALLATNNLSDVGSAATARTNLGATTVGGNVFTLSNPSAITFLRVNADNSVSALSASSFRTAIGAGTGGGDLSGPSSSVDNHVAIFDSTTGKLLKDGGAGILANGCTITPQATPATNEVGYLGAPQNIENGTYTTVMADAGKHLYHTSGTAHTWTIDSNANVAYPIGTVLTFVNESGGGIVTLAITSDTLRWGSSTGSRSLAANGTATALKVTSTAWRLTGDGIT